jgi:hypothetical protein
LEEEIQDSYVELTNETSTMSIVQCDFGFFFGSMLEYSARELN